MQALGEDMRHAAHRTSDAAHRAADAARHKVGAIGDRTEGVRHRAGAAADDVREGAHHAADAVREGVHLAQEKYAHAKEEVKVRAEAVGESGRRAARAPRRVGSEMKAGASAYVKGFATSIGLMIGMGIVALTAWILLTIGLVMVLAPFIGLGLAALAVTVVYLLAAWALSAAASKAREAGRAKLREHMKNSKDEMRYVAQPVRNAFGRGRAGI